MKEAFLYGILVPNNKDFYLDKLNTEERTKISKDKYAIIERVVYENNVETNRRIIYSNDLTSLVEKLKTYPSYYDKVNGVKKDLQGNITY